jgi:hypothetical protein
LLAGVLLTLSLCACIVGDQSGSKAGDIVDIQEAVFRYQFEHNASSLKQSADYYCLGTRDRGDPSKQLMQRFADHSPPVVAVSKCRIDAHMGVSRAQVAGSGLIFNVTDIKWLSPSEVEVSGGYYEGGLSSSGDVYRVKLIEGVWRVVEDRMDWIS